jgi:hypothetical protein
MSIKATSILRSALLGAVVVAWTMAPALAIDEGFAPRPDFPGAKQANPTSKSRAQHMRGKRHTSYRYRGTYSRPRIAAAGAAMAPTYGYGYGNNYGYGNYYGGYVGAPVAQNYNYGYGYYGYPGYAAQDARLAQNPARLRAIRQNYARER